MNLNLNLKNIKRVVVKAMATTLLAGVVVSAQGAGSASAITPAQTTSSGSAKAIYGDLDKFWMTNFTNWGYSSYLVRPTVHYYNSTVQACGTTLPANNSFACKSPYVGHIWFGTGWTQGLHNRFGDYGSGVILAHEWGHVIQYSLRWTSRTGTIGSELFADCLAGMYTRYGITVSGRLNSADYAEGFNTLAAIAGGDHGTAKQRTDWYAYGYTSYNINSCYRALT